MSRMDRPDRFRGRRAPARMLAAFGAAFAVALAPMQPALAFQEPVPIYRDASRTVDERVEDLLSRMTLEEKAAQMVGVWLSKGDIQTPEGDFSPEEASENYPHGLGQISRPSDRRGVGDDDPTGGAAAGASEGAVNRTGAETAEYINAAPRGAGGARPPPSPRQTVS